MLINSLERYENSILKLCGISIHDYYVGVCVCVRPFPEVWSAASPLTSHVMVGGHTVVRGGGLHTIDLFQSRSQ